MKPRNIFVAFLLAIVITGSFQAQDSKKLNLDLFLDWEYVINPQISPDGSQVVLHATLGGQD